MAQQQSSDWQSRREAQPLSSTNGQRMILRLRDLRVTRKVDDYQPSPSDQNPPSQRPIIQPPEQSIAWLEELEMAEQAAHSPLEQPPTKSLGHELQHLAEFALGESPEEDDLDQLSLLPPGQSIPPISLIPDPAPITESTANPSESTPSVSPRPQREPARPSADPDREQRRVAILRGAWLNRVYITGISATILLATYLILNGFGSQRPDAAPKLDDSLFTFENEMPSTRLNEAPPWSSLKESETVVTSNDPHVARFDGDEAISFTADRSSREISPLSNPRFNPGIPATIVGPTDREPVASSPPARETDGYRPSFNPPSDDLDDIAAQDNPQFRFAGGIDSDSHRHHTGTADQARRSLDQEPSLNDDHWALREPTDNAKPRSPATGNAEPTFPSESTRSWEMPSTQRTPATSDSDGWLDNSQSASQAAPRRGATQQPSWDSLEDSPEQNNVPYNRGDSYVDRNTIQNPYVEQSVQHPANYRPIESFEPYPPPGPRQAELLGIEPYEREIRR